MTDTLLRYAPFILGLFVFLVYVGLILYYFRSHSDVEEGKVSIGWLLVLGPVILLVQHVRKRNRGSLTKSEGWGWAFVIVLLFSVFAWKIIAKL